MTALARLGAVSRQYQEAADEYYGVSLAAAQAEAEYRSKRAQAVLRYKASEDRMSNAEAETRADADEKIAGLLLERLTTAAIADSHKQKMIQLREQVATGRTMAVDSRTVDQMHAANLSGAA